MSVLKKLVAWLKSLFIKVEDAVEHKLQGWIPDAIDTRDQVFSLAAPLPAAVDLRPSLRPVESQGALNSCVGHATTTALETVLKTSDLSRLYAYYNARSLEGRATMDAGCSIRNAIKGIVANGVAPESLWPYNTSQVAVKPPATAYTAGVPLAARVGYAQVTNLTALKTALATGLPVVFGFTVPSTFTTVAATTGVLPYPVAGVSFIGAHAVLAVGYDDARGVVIVRNSFGPNWGKSGYFEMPYQWFANMTSLVCDAWVLSAK